MYRRKLGGCVFTPNAGGVKKHMERLCNKIGFRDTDLCCLFIFSINGTSRMNCRDV